MKLLILILTALLDIVPSGDATLQQLQKRDSILIADQIRYGVTIEDVKAGEKIALPDFSAASNDTLTILGGWQLDTLVNGKAVRSRNAKAAARLLRKPFALKASIVLVPFEEGHYALPDVPVIRDYPVTFKELLPWIGGGLLAAALIALAVWLIIRASKRKAEALKPKDPAYIVALRELDKYRSDKYWAPDKQKAFYSGITDALKFYMDERFGVDAPEMTTAELFDALKSDKDITPEMYSSLKELFERADFVKFAKHIASEQENAAALPLAVRFVTTTYQTDLEKETGGQEAADD